MRAIVMAALSLLALALAVFAANGAMGQGGVWVSPAPAGARPANAPTSGPTVVVNGDGGMVVVGPSTTEPPTGAPRDRRPPQSGERPGGGVVIPLGSLETEKAAYLGISTSPISPVLTEQLSLPKGVGLVVERVEAEGPAKTAGLQAHDILTRLNDQIVINEPQLIVLIRTFKAGDEVKLTVIRKGQQQVLTAKLIEKDVPKVITFGPMQEERPSPGTTTPGVFVKRPPPVSKLEGGTAQMADGKHALTLTVREGTKNLVVKDVSSGKELFNGPVDTAEQRAKLPEGVAEKLRVLERIFAGQIPGTGWTPVGGGPGSPLGAPATRPNPTNSGAPVPSGQGREKAPPAGAWGTPPSGDAPRTAPQPPPGPGVSPPAGPAPGPGMN